MSSLFSIRHVFKQSTSLFKENFVLLVGGGLLLILASVVPQILSEVFSDMWWMEALLSLAVWVLSALITLGFAKVSLGLIRNEDVEFKDLWSESHHVLRFIGGSILVSLASGLFLLITLGLLFLVYSGPIMRIIETNGAVGLTELPLIALFVTLAFIIAGIIQILFIFFPYSIVGEDAPLISSLKRSFDLAKSSLPKLIAFIFIILVINIIGALVVGIGLLITIPFSMLATACVYEAIHLKKSGVAIREEVNPPLIQEEETELSVIDDEDEESLEEETTYTLK